MRLQLPPEQVRVIYPAIGGAFGGREDMSVQIVLALAVMRLAERGVHRPVKIIWSREESIVGPSQAPPVLHPAPSGAPRPTARWWRPRCELISDAGAYAYTSTKVLGNATLMCTGPYVFPHAQRGRLHGLHQQRAGRRLPRLWRAAGRLRGRAADGEAGRGAGPRPGRDAHEEPAARGRPLHGRHAVPGRRDHRPGGGALRRRSRLEARGRGCRPARQPGRSPTCAAGAGFACAFKNIGFSFGAPENSAATVELHGDDRDRAGGASTRPAPTAARARTRSLPRWRPTRSGCRSSKVELVMSDTATVGQLGQRLGFAADLYGGQRHQGRGRGGAEEVAGRRAPGHRELHLSGRAPRPRFRRRRPATPTPISPMATWPRRSRWRWISRPAMCGWWT